MKYSFREAANVLGVCPATVRNWRKSGLLTSLEKNVVETLCEKIADGTCPRLRKRANRRCDSRTFDPKEYGTFDDAGRDYQSRIPVGEKACLGAYYTPPAIVDMLLEQLALCPNQTLLDPCCGSGIFLVRAAQKFHLPPENLFGFDRDPVAVRLARKNLREAFPDRVFEPAVFHADFLAWEGRQTWDAIATNPPWGAERFASSENWHNPIPTKETFALFLVRGMQTLRDGGRFAFLLPESLCVAARHAALRDFLETDAHVTHLAHHGRIFTHVMSPVVSLAGEKRSTTTQHSVDWIPHSTETKEQLERLYALPHQTLAGHAEWALGIVTGDNTRFVKNHPDAGEPVLRGRDIQPFAISPPERFLRWEPEKFQQTASEEKYRAAEKLVYRFITDRPIFALDTQKRLTLNSANVLIPHLPGMSSRVVLAYLNSRTMQWIYRQKFPGRKVLRSQLEQLPFPHISAKIHEKIEKITGEILSGKNLCDTLNDTIDSTFRIHHSTLFQ
ncbi:MAG: TaqI-like C-terminal specificity domain-containing protein [Planctomycetia bacterium]|nr:TaqI-like C-terminal specificity domain-containing protein [Planctomycetia bacterium]